MTIESIFSKLSADKGILLGEESHKSLEAFTDQSNIFYVPTLYEEISSNLNARYIIFSAPGASGKSALAKYIAKKYKGIYWNLANIGIGENTFYGTLWRALKQEDLIDYWDKLKNGKSVLVLDAFDEAEMISGRTGIEFFLNDLEEAVSKSIYPSVVLLARTETALFLTNFCKDKGIPYSQYEIGFFTEKNARTFVVESYLSREIGSQLTPAISRAIDEIFLSIKNVLTDTSLYRSFIGYAPILQAIERTIAEERNTAKLLSKINHEKDISQQLIYRILGELLVREQGKVVNALQKRWVKKDTSCIDFDRVYSTEEQIVRIIEYIVTGELVKDSLYETYNIPGDYMDEYLDIMLPFVEQHPFIQNLTLSKVVDFTGPAFRDYAIACALCCEYDFLAKEFLADRSIPSHYPSQLLFDFYKLMSNACIKGDLFSVLYESFKAKEKAGYKALTSLSGGKEDLNATFSLFNEKGEEVDDAACFYYDNSVDVLSLERISDGYIDFEGTVEIKGMSNGSRIADSSIFADRLKLSSDRIELGVSSNKQLILSSKQDVVVNQSVNFEIRKAEDGTVKIDFPNVKSFYKLIGYSASAYGEEDSRYDEFVRFFIKVLNSMRSHSKDMPAKDKEKIDFIYIGNSDFRKAVMKFLISKGIFFIDPYQSHLYKLRTDALAQYGISWVLINKGEYGNMKQLFDEFITGNPDIVL